VKRLEEDRPPPKNGRKRNRLAVSDVYEVIKKSNSSLSRQKRKPLEDAIERVLEFHKQEADDSDSEAAIETEENKSNKVSKLALRLTTNN
jgi:ribosome biogenesis ATPase